MPIYEYRCGRCDRVTSFFTRSINAALTPVCSHCQSGDMRRRMSPFAQGKTAAAVHENHPAGRAANPRDYYRDPRNIGRKVEESYQRHGLEMPAAVRDNIAAARAGALPKELDL